MRWRDFARRLDEQPGFREAYDAQFPYANVALAVLALRERHGLTQRQLAERIGAPQPVIARLESGRHPAEIKLLSRIATAVGERWTVEFGTNAHESAELEPARSSGDPLLDAFNAANTTADFQAAASIAERIAADPSTARRRLALALDAYNRGDHASAERWGREALSDADLPRPSKEVATLVVGRAVLNQERPRDAVRVLDGVRRPKHIGWLRDAALAEAHLDAGDMDRAQAAVDRVLNASSEPEAHYLAARIAWHRDAIWSALEHVIVFRAARPEDVSGRLLHGSILGFIGDRRGDPEAHEAALVLFDPREAGGDREATRLHGLTAARVGRWETALHDAEVLADQAQDDRSHDHAHAIEHIVIDVFSNLPDDADWSAVAERAAALLGEEHEIVRLQRALAAAVAGDLPGALWHLETAEEDIDRLAPERQMAIAAAYLAGGRFEDAKRVLARNIDVLASPDALVRLAGVALEVDDAATASIALQRLGETEGTTGEVAAIALRLLAAVERANEVASITGTLVGAPVWGVVQPTRPDVAPSESVWEGRHEPASRVMDRLTQALLH